MAVEYQRHQICTVAKKNIHECGVVRYAVVQKQVTSLLKRDKGSINLCPGNH